MFETAKNASLSDIVRCVSKETFAFATYRGNNMQAPHARTSKAKSDALAMGKKSVVDLLSGRMRLTVP